MKSGVMTMTDCRHWLAFGKELGVRPDPNLQVLRPESFFYQELLESQSLRASRLQFLECFANRRHNLIANGRRFLRITASLFFDDPFQQADHESDSGGFNGLQIDWGEQPCLSRIALMRWRILGEFVQRTDRLTGDGGDARRRSLRFT